MNFCPNCGAKLPRPGEDQFCMNCGAKIPVIPADGAAASAPAVAEGTAFAGVPVSSERTPHAPEVPASPQPRGEDLLNMIEVAQNQAAASQPDDIFAGEAPALFAEAPILTGESGSQPPAEVPPEDLFAPANKPASSLPNMFGTAVMQAVKPPPPSQSADQSHPQPASKDIPARPAPAPAPPTLSKDGPAPDLFAGETFSAAPEELGQPAEALTADASQPSLFDTAAMLATSGEEAPLFKQSARQPAPAKASGSKRAPARGDTHGQTAQRPRTAKRPLPEQVFEDFDETETQLTPPKPRRPAPLPVSSEPLVEIKKPSVIGRVLTAFAVLIIFLVVCAATILTMLYFRNRPSQTIDTFTAAVAAGDVAKLNKLATVEGVAPGEVQWKAFCAAFSQTAELNQLKSQLLMMSEGTENAEYLYPAVTIEKKPFILFIDRYSIKIQAVSLLAPGAAEGTAVLLDNEKYDGTLQAEGVQYSPLMPGRYQCRVVPPGVLPENVPPVDIEIFAVGGPNFLNGEAPKVAVTISNCVSDDAILYVNDQPVAELPVGGVVTIPNVALGSTIRISAIKDGVTMEASLVFSDLNAATQLAFADYTSQGEPATASEETSGSDAAPSADELNAVMGTFYQSYLESINQQNMDGIQNTTASANTSLGARIKNESNASSLFQYTGVAVDAQSIKTTTSGDLPALHFNAKFQFNHKPREGAGEYAASSNYQSVEMVLQDGKWLVNKMTFVSEGDYNNHVLAVFE